jgi:ribonuclease R
MPKPPSKRGNGRTSAPTRGKQGAAPGKTKGADLPAWMPHVMRNAGSSAPVQPPGKAPRKTGKPPASRQPRGRGGFDDPHADREAQRYADPIASREAILQVLSAADGPIDTDALATHLQLTAPDRRDALDKRLAAMRRDGQLLQNRRGHLAPARSLDLIAGTVIANPEGFGFLRPDSIESRGKNDDLFLPPGEMRKVMHGDRVLASVTGMDRRGRSEGAIVEVLERRQSRLIGRFESDAGICYVVPDDRRIQRNVQIPPDASEGAKHGQLVVCEITQPPTAQRPPIGRVLTVLGDKLTPSLVVEAAIHGHDLPHEFPPEVLAEASAVPVDVTVAEAAARTDLRAIPLVTIDGEDAKDFDDAVWCEPNRDGFRLLVAIADVSHYVRPGTPLDDEAQRRATSVYFPGFVVPMLPETLSNGICSLKPKVDRLCMVCAMQISRDGEVVDSEFRAAVMNSHARLTYTEVWNAIAPEGDVLADDRDAALARIGPLLPQVQHLHQLFKVLAKARKKRGAIEFESSEVRFVVGPKGEVVQAGMLQRNDAHKLIEECMIAANVEAAKFLLARNVPAPYRIHDKPPESKYADLLEFLKEFKLSMPAWSKVQPRDFTQLLTKIRERPEAALLESVLLRSQSLAVYQPENVGHFGLALEAYAHFTSPIRRYPDLLVHRAIRKALGEQNGAKDPAGHAYTPREMATLSLQSSERARRADEAEREVDERYRAAWMEQHVGGQFDGVISGVTSFGLFVELDDSKVNGLVHVTQLANDYYHFDPIRKTLTGERRGREYRLGDRARVVVLKASLEERKIDFRLVEDGDAYGVRAKSEPKPPAPRGTPAKKAKKKY